MPQLWSGLGERIFAWPFKLSSDCFIDFNQGIYFLCTVSITNSFYLSLWNWLLKMQKQNKTMCWLSTLFFLFISNCRFSCFTCWHLEDMNVHCWRIDWMALQWSLSLWLKEMEMISSQWADPMLPHFLVHPMLDPRMVLQWFPFWSMMPLISCTSFNYFPLLFVQKPAFRLPNRIHGKHQSNHWRCILAIFYLWLIIFNNDIYSNCKDTHYWREGTARILTSWWWRSWWKL